MKPCSGSAHSAQKRAYHLSVVSGFRGTWAPAGPYFGTMGPTVVLPGHYGTMGRTVVFGWLRGRAGRVLAADPIARWPAVDF